MRGTRTMRRTWLLPALLAALAAVPLAGEYPNRPRPNDAELAHLLAKFPATHCSAPLRAALADHLKYHFFQVPGRERYVGRIAGYQVEALGGDLLSGNPLEKNTPFTGARIVGLHFDPADVDDDAPTAVYTLAWVPAHKRVIDLSGLEGFSYLGQLTEARLADGTLRTATTLALVAWQTARSRYQGHWHLGAGPPLSVDKSGILWRTRWTVIQRHLRDGTSPYIRRGILSLTFDGQVRVKAIDVKVTMDWTPYR